jgi:hypothetical protein
LSKENGYLQHRRGIWEHVRDGRLSLQDVAVHQYIASQADTRTGIWNGSAGALAGELCISPRVARRFLERLSRGDYIKRFPMPGKHVCYPILVHKFAITDGEHRGEHLNALASNSPVDLRYFPGEQMGEHRGEQLSSQKRIENREERKTRAEKPAPPDSRYGPFLEFAKASFELKHKRPPTWDCFGKDGSALAAFLRRAPHVTKDVWQVHVLNFFDSTEVFTVKQGGSLSYFISRFDTFASGPILEGGINGKFISTAERRSQQTANALNRVFGDAEKMAGDIRRALPPRTH